jgi:hypothetical protein
MATEKKPKKNQERIKNDFRENLRMKVHFIGAFEEHTLQWFIKLQGPIPDRAVC